RDLDPQKKRSEPESHYTSTTRIACRSSTPRGKTNAGACGIGALPAVEEKGSGLILKGYRIRAVELRHVRYFLAVAEHLNFSKAAQQLHIAQPQPRRQIRALKR